MRTFSNLFAGATMSQFHRTLCQAAGDQHDLQACSFFGSEKGYAMLEAGQGLPWQNTMEKLIGTREMVAGAIVEYFEPLMDYLKKQNDGRTCG